MPTLRTSPSLPAPGGPRALASAPLWTSLAVGLLIGLPEVARAEPATVAVVAAGVPPASAEATRLRSAAQEALAARPGLQPLDPGRARFLFETQAPAPRDGPRAAARGHLDRALDLLRNFQVADAKAALAAATTLLEPDVGLEAARDLDQRRLALTVAIAHAAREQKALSKALSRYAARFGTTPPERGLWPPDLERRLATIAARAQTKLRIQATPVGQAWVDGRPVGATPLTVDSLSAGRHRVEVRAPGHLPALAWAKTRSTKLADVRIELAPDLGRRLAKLPATGPLPTDLEAAILSAAERGPASMVLIATPAPEGRVSVRLLETGAKDRRPAQYGPVVAPTPREGFDLVWAERAADSSGAGGSALRPWAFGAAGLGVAAAAVGVGLRLWAQDTQDPLQTRRGALTQTEAFGIQDRAESRAVAGTVLIAAGAALVAGGAGLFTWDLLAGDSP